MFTIRLLTACTLSTLALSAGPFVSSAEAGSPSFNCAKADSRAEELICGDKELAIMDVEATRLFRLVRDGGKREDEKKVLNEDRARWQKVRDECWISEDLRGCIISSYAVRIHFLRENHAEARASDQKGITKGPFNLQCKDLKQPVKATFISSNPPVSAVQFSDGVHVGIGSGARYFARSPQGDMAFWTQGDDAFFKMPNGVSYNCVLERQ
ncbi:MAG: hypothetical protein JWM58_4122 [Rhizobium sp.]|nr:hypothetical protein [Rhizobium sp.]